PEIYTRSHRRGPSEKPHRRPAPLELSIVNLKARCPPAAAYDHGLYVLEGKAAYRLNEDWVEVEAGDYMWLRAFCPQACYAGGPGKFRYLLYKDVNRHMALRSPTTLSRASPSRIKAAAE
ncbi:hypothetical protein QO231_25520, partial [Sedimentitalea todarodis]|nr:hypothetical protein [Sedimentitalea todarodis]